MFVVGLGDANATESAGGNLFLEVGRGGELPATAAPARQLDARLGRGSTLEKVPRRPWGPALSQEWKEGPNGL